MEAENQSGTRCSTGFRPTVVQTSDKKERDDSQVAKQTDASYENDRRDPIYPGLLTILPMRTISLMVVGYCKSANTNKNQCIDLEYNDDDDKARSSCHCH